MATREAAPAFDRIAPFLQYRDAIPRCLPLPDRTVARRIDLGDGKRRIPRFQLLQTDHIRRFARQPFEQPGQTGANAVDVKRRYFYRAKTDGGWPVRSGCRLSEAAAIR